MKPNVDGLAVSFMENELTNEWAVVLTWVKPNVVGLAVKQFHGK